MPEYEINRELSLFGGRHHLKLTKITPSDHPGKKWDAHFLVDGDHVKVVSFGARGYEDFTEHHDPERKRSYLERHAARENWAQPDTPGALSRWVLWNKKAMKASVADFRRRFRLGG